MTLRYASLASPTVRPAYDQAMSKARSRLTLPIAPVGQAIVPDRVRWLRGKCSRPESHPATVPATSSPRPAATPTSANNYTTSVEFLPALQSQLADITMLRDDAANRGWNTEVARHARVISSLTRQLDRLAHNNPPSPTA
jgi:hypothetical protein